MANQVDVLRAQMAVALLLSYTFAMERAEANDPEGVYEGPRWFDELDKMQCNMVELIDYEAMCKEVWILCDRDQDRFDDVLLNNNPFIPQIYKTDYWTTATSEFDFLYK